MSSPLLSKLVIGSLLFTPGFAVYSMAFKEQQDLSKVSRFDTGQALIDSKTALDRTRVCLLARQPNSQRLTPSLIGVYYTPEAGAPPAEGVILCAPDGSTAKIGKAGFTQVAKTEDEDVLTFQQRLIDRGLLSRRELNSMTLLEGDNTNDPVQPLPKQETDDDEATNPGPIEQAEI